MINEIKALLEKAAQTSPELNKTPIYPFSRMQIDNDYKLVQQVVNSNKQSIIISTNVIETGFTIPNLSYVIDTLKFLQVYYNPILKTDIMRYMPISTAM